MTCDPTTECNGLRELWGLYEIVTREGKVMACGRKSPCNDQNYFEVIQGNCMQFSSLAMTKFDTMSSYYCLVYNYMHLFESTKLLQRASNESTMIDWMSKYHDSNVIVQRENDVRYQYLMAATSTTFPPRTNSSASLLWRWWHPFTITTGRLVTVGIPCSSWLIRDWLKWFQLRDIRPAWWRSHSWSWSNSSTASACRSPGCSHGLNTWVLINRRRLLWRWRRERTWRREGTRRRGW